MHASDYTDPLLFWHGIADQFVYFIQAGDDGAVKIGRAKQPTRRLASLQTGSPVTLHLRHVVPGDHALESALHRRFADAHVAGEWFGAEWTQVILTYAAGVERAAIDAYDWSGAPPMLTGNEFRTAKEIVELRAHIERMTLMGFSREEICRYGRLTECELDDQIVAMRATKIYNLRFRRAGHRRWGRGEQIAQWQARREDAA